MDNNIRTILGGQKGNKIFILYDWLAVKNKENRFQAVNALP